MSDHPSRGSRPTATAMPEPLAPGDLDAPIHLADLLDGRGRRLLESAARDLGVAVHLIDDEGAAVLGDPVPLEVVAEAGPMLASIAVEAEPEIVAKSAAAANVANVASDPEAPRRAAACSPSEGAGDPEMYYTRQILHEGDLLGTLVLGAFAPERAAALLGPARHLTLVLDNLVDTGLERLLSSRMHVASMQSAWEELQQKNMRLAAAVERLQELDRVKSSFLATVSHELRTPLTSVIGYSEMLYEGLAGPLNDEQKDYVRTVMEKGDQLLAIITGILDISRIEAGGVQLDRAEVALEPLLDSAISTVAPTVRRKRLQLVKELAPELPRLWVDKDKVRQVLINLLGNAVKFTPEGGEVRVVVEPGPLRRAGVAAVAPSHAGSSISDGGEHPARAEEQRAVRVMVVDTGIGIPREAMGRIFDPFYQVDSSSTRQYGGTGLGLAIVKSFVHAHGGSVWVDSCPGKGSRFFVTLPAAT